MVLARRMAALRELMQKERKRARHLSMQQVAILAARAHDVDLIGG